MSLDDAIPDGCFSGRHKDVVHRNAIIRIAGDKESQNLECQKSAFQRAINKEEFDLKAQYHGLIKDRSSTFHSNQSACERRFNFEHGGGYGSKEPTTAPDISINPYPVTFKSKPARRRRRTVSICDVKTECKTSVGYSQKAVEYEDSIRPRAWSDLPPIRQSRTSEVTCSRTSLSGSVESVSLEAECRWLGDPHAISSVRRPRRSVSEQRRRLSDIRKCADSCREVSLENELPTARVTRHLSLINRHSRSPCSLAGASDTSPLPHHKSLPVITTSLYSPILPITSIDVFTFPRIKESVLPFGIVLDRGENDWKSNLRRRCSSKKRSKSDSQTCDKITVADRKNPPV